MIYREIEKALCENLELVLNAAGLNQSTLAEYLDVTRQCVNHWSRGKVRMSRANLLAIILVLKRRYEYLDEMRQNVLRMVLAVGPGKNCILDLSYEELAELFL